MSSEQVIAEVVAEMRKAARDFSDHNGCASFCNMSRRWADRLSTPAAGGDDAAKMVVYRLRQCALGGPLAYDAIAIDEAADLIGQLQIRNAKQAAQIAELQQVVRDVSASAESSEAEVERLQAIAKEYNELIKHMDAGGDFYEFQRDAALRESSTPAIWGET